jgi:hypothetical protein
VIKRTQKKAIKRQTQILAEICQNRTADKGRIFEEFSVAQIKKCSTNESFLYLLIKGTIGGTTLILGKSSYYPYDMPNNNL